jgi:anti-sigma28 factor (negative regulator of flagellin synthesis)
MQVGLSTAEQIAMLDAGRRRVGQTSPSVAVLLEKVKTNDVRTDVVTNIKSQIDSGTYENEKKLDVAIDKLIDDL